MAGEVYKPYRDGRAPTLDTLSKDVHQTGLPKRASAMTKKLHMGRQHRRRRRSDY